jgi:hypothetical protein
MTSVRVGAALNALPGPRYFAKHGLVELHPSISFPKTATLSRWRAQIPEACEVAIAVTRRTHAGKAGALRFDKPGAQGWVDDSIATLRPRFVVLATGPELSTGSRDRALLEAFVASVQARGPRVVWQPRGLWEAEVARTLAERIGCLLALDLLGTDPTTLAPVLPQPAVGGIVYGRIQAIGVHARLGDGHLRRALDEAVATGADEVRLVVESEDAYRRASRLASMVEGLAEEASGLTAPRRRSSTEAGEDEDELDGDDETDDEDELDGDDEADAAVEGDDEADDDDDGEE